MWTILLIIGLFLFFLSLTLKTLPNFNIKDLVVQYMLPGGGAAGMFLLTTLLLGTPLAGIFWGVLGWFLPGWIIQVIKNHKEGKLRGLARDFITSSAGLYAAGQTTPEVIQSAAKKVPYPFSEELQGMIIKRNLNATASFPRMFEDLASKYNISEFKAMAAILAASERAGGPYAASKGLKRLGQALRQRAKLLTERAKALIEVKVAAVFVIVSLVGGLMLDITVFRDYFLDSKGKLVLSLSSALIVGLIFMACKVAKSDDL